MSLSKEQSFNDNYRRDSFSDRVCDDLSEVILQFLSLTDKFRFECVSKQFQRTVFRKHNELNYDRTLEERIKSNKIDCKTFIQKLAHITSLRSNVGSNTSFLEDKDIDLIIEKCNNLVDIKWYFCHMSKTTRHKFVNKFGTKLISFSVRPNDIEMVAKYFPNIEELNPMNFHRSSMTCDRMPGLVLSKLKKLFIRFEEPEITPHFNEQITSFQTFIESHKSLTHLRIELFVKNENTYEFVFKQISNLIDLIELCIKFSNAISDQILAKGLKELSLNCHKVKSLTLEWIEMEEQINGIRFVNVLKYFKQLKRLDIKFHAFPQITPDSDPFKYLSESFEGLENITHLKLRFPPDFAISYTLLSNIDKYLPKLQKLIIFGKMQVNDNTAYALSQLLNLKVLILFLSEDINQSIHDLIRSQLLNNCRKIVSIKL